MKASQSNPEVKAVVTEATRALTRLDADRLEELAMWCQTRSGDLWPLRGDERMKRAREVAQEMAILARVLDATRANLAVMKRPRELHAENLEYRQ